MKASLSSSLLSSLPAVVAVIGGRRHPALACLTVGRGAGCAHRLGGASEPHVRGTEHSPTEFPALLWIPCVTWGKTRKDILLELQLGCRLLLKIPAGYCLHFSRNLRPKQIKLFGCQCFCFPSVK